MNGLREVCHCGHDVVSHHEKKKNCLSAFCACVEYVNEREPKRVPTLRAPSCKGYPKANVKPHANPACRCVGCNDFLYY